MVTAASGEAKFKVDKTQTSIDFDLQLENGTDLLGVAGAHIQCAPAGQNDPVVAFPAAAVPGGFDGDIKFEAIPSGSNIVNPACGVPIGELAQSMRDGNTYVSVHSPDNPGGEIRGQIIAE